MTKLDRSVPPPVSHFSEICVQPEEVVMLPNGIDVHLIRQGELPLTRLSLLWDGGELDYPSQAVTTITAMTLQEGTKKITAEKAADLTDYCGARLAGSASNHHVCLDLISVNSRLAELLPLVEGIATEADFAENAVVAAARRMSAMRAVQLERVAFRATERLHALLQGTGNPASKIVTPEEFAAVGRGEVTGLYERISRSKLHVFVGGRPDDALLQKILATFGRIRPAQYSDIRIMPFEPEPPVDETVVMDGVKQCAVAMGIPTIGRDHPDYIRLRLAVMALGGYFGSRLMSNIREEKGLTYGINTSLLGTPEGAFMEISAQCDRRYVDSVVAESIFEIKNLSENPPQGDELDRLRLHAWSRLAQSADSVFGTTDYYMTMMKVGTPPDYFQQQLEEIGNLTSEKIAEAARLYLDESRLTVVRAGNI